VQVRCRENRDNNRTIILCQSKDLTPEQERSKTDRCYQSARNANISQGFSLAFGTNLILFHRGVLAFAVFTDKHYSSNDFVNNLDLCSDQIEKGFATVHISPARIMDKGTEKQLTEFGYMVHE
jgi:hypothetical protein